ncbi:transporter substrate-binding domain-containing protein [Vibrio sp. 624788]|uniref:transporter substrate-binding domain-containing protein n=1 Tax=Vibrio sp. 624788 TaxID=1234362 RepID=UPI0003679AC8|nr:transporter substrate-binding domain-containing protein [Vibrio sp. 624788]
MKTLFLLLIALTSLSFSSTAEETTLSAAQHSYIQNKQKLVIAKPMYLFNQVWEDFVVNRNQDTCDSVQGMLRDYLNIEVEVKEYFSSRALLSAIASGEADLTIGFAETRRRAEQFEFSDSLYDIQNVYWYRDDVAKNTPHDQLKWVCIKSSLFCQLLNQQGVSDPMVVNSTSELLPAIANGFADATILDLTSVQSYYSVMTPGEWQGALSFSQDLPKFPVQIMMNQNDSVMHSIIERFIHDKETTLPICLQNSSIIFTMIS